MIKFDCGRALGLEKRLKREPDEADRTEAKVKRVVGVLSPDFSAELDAHCPAELGAGKGARDKGFPAADIGPWIPGPPL